jgi:TetR/AcrR family fatty acid metabolism transcriptional regulator
MNNKTNREQIIREAKSNIILDAALKVFAEKGFYTARLEDIAAEAGFSKASLYTYYNDKEAIFLNLANREFDQLITATKECILPGEDVFVSLEKMLRVGFVFFANHFAFLDSAMNIKAMNCGQENEIQLNRRNLMEQFKSRFNAILQVFINFIDSGQTSGFVRTDMDSKVLAGQIMSLHRGVLMNWAIQKVQGDVETEIKNIIMFTKNGLSSPE